MRREATRSWEGDREEQGLLISLKHLSQFVS